MLGAAHHLGAGVAKDPVTALAWLTRARISPASSTRSAMRCCKRSRR